MEKCHIISILCLMSGIYLFEDDQIKIISNVLHLGYWLCWGIRDGELRLKRLLRKVFYVFALQSDVDCSLCSSSEVHAKVLYLK